MRTRHLALLLAAAALLAPAPAHAGWGPTQDMGAVTGNVAYDGNARGDRILVWQSEQRGFVFAQGRPGEQLGPAMPLPYDPNRVESTPRVELDERGNALLVWTYFDETDPEFEIRGPGPCCDGLRARVIRRDGSFTGAKTLAPAGNYVQLADMQIAPSGALGITFTRNAYERYEPKTPLEARFGTVARGLGARETVFRSATAGPYALSYVRGRPRVQYASGPGDGYDTARASIREIERRSRGRWRRLRDPLRQTQLGRSTVRFATSAGGHQAATWLRSQSGPTFRTDVYAATRDPGGSFRVRRLGRDDYFFGASPAIEPSGNALVAWPSVRRGALVGTLRRPRGAFGPLQTIAIAEHSEIGAPGVDVNARGHGLLVWSERPFGTGASGERPRLIGAFRNTRGSMLEQHVIPVEQGPGFFGFTYFATLDREGRGHVVYTSGGRLYEIAARIGG